MRADVALADPVDRADEAHDELVGRMLVQRARIAGLLDLAVVHQHDLVGDVHRLLLVVRDDQRGRVRLVVQPAQPDAQLLAHACVERAERLVEEQDGRVDRERPREPHALALPAGELRGIALAEGLELDELQQLADALLDLGLRPLLHAQTERDVLVHGHVPERGVVLEDEADPAALRRERRHVRAVEEDAARVRPLEPGDHAQKRRLAASARTEKGGQRAAPCTSIETSSSAANVPKFFEIPWTAIPT